MVKCHTCGAVRSRNEMKLENRDLLGRIKVVKCPDCKAILGIYTF